MAKISFSGLDIYMERLKRLGANSEEAAKEAVFNGAGAIAAAVRTGLESIPTDESWGTETGLKNGLMRVQKDGLLKSLGISPIDYDGTFLNAKIGFAGYNDFKTETYPQGQPNQMIANSAESGTSFMRKTPFFAAAVRRAKPEAEKIMGETFEKKINDIMKE